MTEGLLGLVREFRAALVGFSPELYSGEDCAVLVEELAAAEKACAAARVRAAARAGACGAHKERGFADASDWMARAAGTSTAAAKAALDMTAALAELPEARAALEAGELSLAQVQELVKTEAECPGSATELLGIARGQSLKSLKEQARDRRLGTLDPEELHSQQHRAKTYRHWRTRLGNVGFCGELPPEVGVPIMNRLDAETDRLWQRARQEAKNGGVEERRAAIAADAFVRLVETGGRGKARSADLVIVCDLRAYRRGHALPGEPCHIVGGGPIPVSLAQELGRDAFLKVVLHDGVKIDTIAHFGRKTPPCSVPPSASGRPRCSRGSHAQRRVATAGTTSSATTSTRSPTAAQLPSTTSNRSAGLITESRPSATARLASSEANPEAQTGTDRRNPVRLPRPNLDNSIVGLL